MRLEAGLRLYGQDIDETTSPIEAGLRWTITKRRLELGGFTGAEIIQSQVKAGVKKLLVGLIPEGRALARKGGLIFDMNGNEVGIITSGGYGPTYGGPIALGYIEGSLSKTGSKVKLQIRKSLISAVITALPFVPHNYFSQ